ncbi:phosphatase PAP2 family protein [Cellulomonas sp. ICMP 17802]|uniref:phosphatase PAP2 family protein n=1 Tax=Cellulomonas sp. ICMP 17802 TaxID=3239199 RepID=UPI00351B1B68
MPYVRRWPVLSVVLGVAALLLGLVAADTTLLQPHGLALDVEIATDVRSALLTPVMLGISFLASPVVACVALVLWPGWLVWRRRPLAAAATFLVVVVGWLAAFGVKLLVARPRPPIDVVHSLAPETGSDSYPSGHVAFAFSIAVAAWFLARGTRWSRPVAVLGAGFVALVAFSRLYLGVHYLGDVVGSVLVSGAAIVLLTGLWHRFVEPALLARAWVAGREPEAAGRGALGRGTSA